MEGGGERRSMKVLVDGYYNQEGEYNRVGDA